MEQQSPHLACWAAPGNQKQHTDETEELGTKNLRAYSHAEKAALETTVHPPGDVLPSIEVRTRAEATIPSASGRGLFTGPGSRGAEEDYPRPTAEHFELRRADSPLVGGLCPAMAVDEVAWESKTVDIEQHIFKHPIAKATRRRIEQKGRITQSSVA